MKVECVFLKMGIKKEAPSLFCFGMSHQALPTAQCSDGALICIDLAHIIEVECVIGLDYQLDRLCIEFDLLIRYNKLRKKKNG